MEQQVKLTNLVELVRQIRYRPSMYLGDKKISTMNNFLYGYIVAIGIHNLEEKDPIAKNFANFHEFTAVKLGRTTNGYGWSTMMIEKSEGDEEKALNLFFEIFEEFAKANS